MHTWALLANHCGGGDGRRAACVVQRGTGIGSTLMRMAEEEAVRRGCRMGTLTTINFQAPEFYARHGWEEFGRIQTAPDVIRIFMLKALIA